MSCSFDEFDVRHVQHQPFRALALRAQEARETRLPAELRASDQPRQRLESHRADFRSNLAGLACLFQLRFVLQLEVDGGNARGGVAQRA
jgi:hypothetical protein